MPLLSFWVHREKQNVFGWNIFLPVSCLALDKYRHFLPIGVVSLSLLYLSVVKYLLFIAVSRIDHLIDYEAFFIVWFTCKTHNKAANVLKIPPIILNAWFEDSKSHHFKVGRITSCQIMLWFDRYQSLLIYPTVEHRESLKILLVRLLVHRSFSIKKKMLQIVYFAFEL